LEELEKFNSSFSEDFKTYTTKNDALVLKHKQEQAKKLDNIERYQRLNSVRIYGIPESDEDDNCTQEVVDVLKRNLGLSLQRNDIDLSHRLCVKKQTENNGNYARPVIARFVRRENTISVLRKRKDLKGTNLSIQVDLTRPRAALLKDHLKKYPNVKCWCDFKGRIWREANASEKRRKLSKIELIPKKFPGIFEDDQVDFSEL